MATVAIAGATDADHARDAFLRAMATLAKLPVDDDTPSGTVVPAEAVPFALDSPEGETLGYGSGED